MPKPGTIHPNYHAIEVTMLDGTVFMTRSTMKGTSVKLEVDPTRHPAWNQDAGQYIDTKNKQVEGFNDRFQGLNFLDMKSAPAAE